MNQKVHEGWAEQIVFRVCFMRSSEFLCCQSRAAELELKLQRGQVDDLEEHQLHVHTAWLWTRDKLLDLIKSISKYTLLLCSVKFRETHPTFAIFRQCLL